MNRDACRVRSGIALAGLTVVALSLAVPFAAASGSKAPFNDPNIDGNLTFCSRAGQPVTSGSLDAVPFVWKAISSSPAPAQFRNASGRATLTSYQPIKFVDPGDWSGGQLTGSSSYSNASHPVAQATNADVPLLNFVQAYPPHWHGLVEIRMIFSGINLPQQISPYPAAVIRVTGNTWSLVSGGGGSCGAGQGVSDESKLLPKKKLKKQEIVVPAGESSAAAAAKASASSQTNSSTSPPGSGTDASRGPGQAAGVSDPSSGGLSQGAKTGIGLGVLAVIGVAVLGILWWRRRPVGGQG